MLTQQPEPHFPKTAFDVVVMAASSGGSPLSLIASVLIALVMVRGAATLFQVTPLSPARPSGPEFPHWGTVKRYVPHNLREA